MLSKVRDEPHIIQSLLFLPALWTNLDPSKIPNPAQLDLLLLLDDTAALDFIIGPTISLETLRLLAALLPAGLLRELWPRVWQWSHFLDTYGDCFPNAPPGIRFFGTFIDLLEYFHAEAGDLVDSTFGVGVLVARAWKVFLQVKDGPEPLGFEDLSRFLARTTPQSSQTLLDEYIEGAGGTPADLAYLVVKHINWGTERKSPTYIRHPVMFVATADTIRYSPFHTALLHQACVPALTRAICSLTELSTEDAQRSCSLCITLLTRQLGTQPIYPWIGQALEAGLLTAIVSLATMPILGPIDFNSIKYTLTQLIPSSVIHHSVFSRVMRSLEDAERAAANARSFSTSTLYRDWYNTVDLMRDRLAVLRQYESEEYISYAACDNTKVCRHLCHNPWF